AFILPARFTLLLRILSLAREFERLSGTTIRLRIGHPISANALSAYRDPEDATRYLRARTFFLANRSGPLHHRAMRVTCGGSRRSPGEAPLGCQPRVLPSISRRRTQFRES